MSKRTIQLIGYKDYEDGLDVTANTDFFESDITGKYPVSNFQLYIVSDTTAGLYVMRTNGENVRTEQLNGGSNITANIAYTFDIAYYTGCSINFQLDSDATILTFIIKEQV